MYLLAMCGQPRPRSDFADAKSNQGLLYPLTETLATTECMNAEQRVGWYVAHAHDDLNLRMLRMFESSLPALLYVDLSRLKYIVYRTENKTIFRHEIVY